MDYFDRWVTRASTVMVVISAIMLLMAMLIITVMVVERNIGLQNSWELEISIELMVASVFLASPYTLVAGGHVKMDLLESILPEWIKHKLALVAKVAGCLICLYLGWSGWEMTIHAINTGERELGVWQPLAWPKYAAVSLGMFMTAVQYISVMHREHRARIKQQNKETSTCRN